MAFDMNVFMQQLHTRKGYIDESLTQYLDPKAYPPVIHEAMNYAVSNGGKRLRPMMVMEGARLAGLEPQTVLDTACAIEMIHCYSLVHDDLPAMDDDDLRRGKPTCHIVYGEANAILTGDALLSLAFELMAGNARQEAIRMKSVVAVLQEVARAIGSQGMIGGQVLDLQWEGQRIDLSALQQLHQLKTGALFTASLRSGAILGGMEAERLAALTDYARHFGLAFQITDDILDVSGDQALIGKPVGSDEKNAKTTYVSLFGADGAMEMAWESVQGCSRALADFGPEAEFLRDLATFILKRDR